MQLIMMPNIIIRIDFFDIFYIQCYASVKNNIDELMFILFLGDLFRFLKEDSLINMYLLAIISL